MSCGKGMTCCLVGGFVAILAGGCVSLDDYRRCFTLVRDAVDGFLAAAGFRGG